jgi:hypothetical protein
MFGMTEDPAIPRSLFDLAVGAFGAVVGGVFVLGRKSERLADHEKRIAILEQERHDDADAMNGKIDALRGELRDDIRSMRAEIREELREIKSDVRDVLRGGSK